MDAISYSYADKQAKRIKKFNENPDSTSGILTQPSVIQTGETVSIPAGRTAVMANTVIDGTVTLDGTMFIPTGSSVDFSNGIKVNGTNIALSIPTSYHLLEGNLSVSNEIITNGFGTTLYTGNGTTQSVTTGIDMSTQWGNDVSETFGGLVWLKSRSNAYDHGLIDTIRGGSSYLASNSTAIAGTASPAVITSFNNNGFTFGTTGYTMSNANTTTYASWNFQTTHRRSGVTNHGKAYTEHYNPSTGFTIIKYEGSGLTGHEIPHHLGRKLGFVTTKSLSAVGDWITNYDDSYYLLLNTTAAQVANSTYIKNDVNKTILLSASSNASSNQYIMYGWANSYFDETNKLIGNYEVGVYQGTGVAGNKITTRGKLASIIIKKLDNTSNWFIHDNQRNNINVLKDGILFPNAPSLEDVTYDYITFNVDSFTHNYSDTTYNTSGGQYLYMGVYDNDSGSGKSKYPRATDTSNVQINNAIIPLAHGIDSNGSKNSIVIANETITGLTYTQGKNYLYKTDTGYGVKSYEPRYLSSELVRRFAGEQPDYYDVDSNKWFNTDAGSELVSNGTFSSGVTTGWTAVASTLSIVNNTIRVTSNSAAYGQANWEIATVIGKKYKAIFKINAKSNTQAGVYIDSLSGTVNNGILVNTGVSTSVGTYSLEFVAQTTSTYIKLVAENVSGYWAQFDDISVFPVDITPTTEITESRNYLNHIVHADQNGQVAYVEELPKIEYKDIIKANEYKGKNACTAWVNFDGTTTPPTIRDSYNISAVIRVSTGNYDIYFEEDMDNTKYSIVDSASSSGTALIYSTEVNNNNKLFNRFTISIIGSSGSVVNANNINIHIDGGKN